MNEDTRYKLEMHLIIYDNQSPHGRVISEVGIKRPTIDELFAKEVWEVMGKAFAKGPTE